MRRFLGLIALVAITVLVLAACSDRAGDDDDIAAGEDQDTVEFAGQSDDDADDADIDDASDEMAEESLVGEAGDSTVDVGVVLSLSGANANYGTPSSRGIELALEDFADGHGPQGISFSSTVLDDEGNATLGVERFMEQIELGADVILGPTLSNTAFEAHPVAQQNGIPVLAISNTAAGITETGEYIFRVSLAEEAVVPQTVELISSAWQPETAALVYSEDDAWSRSSADVFRGAAAGHDIQIVTEQDISSDGGDYTAQIESIADADPDVILISALESASIAFVAQAREHGLQQDIACGNGCNTGTFIEETKAASEGLVVGSAWHIDVDNEQSLEFVERYRALHGIEPDQFSAQAYAGMQILAEAASNAGQTSPDALRNALAELGTVDTVLGPFSFDENRDGSHPAVIKVVQSGDFVPFGK